MQVRKQQLELDMEPNRLVPNKGKESIKAVHRHPAY